MRSDPPVRIPRVGRRMSRTAMVPLAIGTLLIGTAVFARMVDARSDLAGSVEALPPLAFKTLAAPAPLTTANPASAPLTARQPPVLLTATPPPATYPRTVRAPSAAFARPAAPESLGGSPLVLDLYNSQRTGDAAGFGQSEPAPAPAPARTKSRSDPTGDAIAAANARLSAAQPSLGNSNERFAQRVGAKSVDVTEARQLQNLDRLVPQGAIVGAVMETALNSDLPGYARALVTKDVFSFDGSAVLIPAGSRVISEYNSGVAQGASRVFIVWNRLVRPDGVSIALGSPAVDELGRGGLGGKVNRHFLQRFGSAILLSVLGGGISAATNALGRGSTVIVNSSSEASSLVTQAAQSNDIPPTIKTNQGALVRIFVARDLDFSAVGPAR